MNSKAITTISAKTPSERARYVGPSGLVSLVVGAAGCNPTSASIRRSYRRGALLFVVSAAALRERLPDLFAGGANRVLLGVTTWDPHLAAQGDHRGAHDHG